MRTFYFTMARGHHPSAPGYVEVQAPDASAARERMHAAYGFKWAFQYDELELVHELDRRKLDSLSTEDSPWRNRVVP